ncbi:7081_t:CDS:2, partial [Cetraspora pellucida]
DGLWNSDNAHTYADRKMELNFFDKGIISRSGGSLRRSWSAIRKQKRDIEQMVTLNEAYSIIHLCAGEVLSRGLGEENLFSPVDNEDNPDEV